jgi:hypothetical protein
MNLSQPILSNGQGIRLLTLTGIVLSASKSSRMLVDQDAPTVLSKDFVIPGRVHASTQTTQELWLQTDDGKEQAVDLTGINLPVRDGQVVSVVYGGPAWSEGGGCFGARNHATGDVRCDITVLGSSLKEWRLAVGAGSSLALWIFATALAIALPAFALSRGGLENKAAMALGGAFIGAFFGFVAWLFIGSNIGPERRATALVAEINELGQQALLHEQLPGTADALSASALGSKAG